MTRAALPLLLVALAGCSAAPGAASRKAADEGYLLGTADAVKQLYWAKQALEAPRSAAGGRTEYYTWEESEKAADGRSLAPETAAVPVFVPSPAPAHGP